MAVTGLHDIDECIQSELLVSALNITTFLLNDGGTFVAKIFTGSSVSLTSEKMRIFIPRVTVAKPSSSRNSSIEAFVVCQNYKPLPGYVPTIWKSLRSDSGQYDFKKNEVNAHIVPFLVSGDVNNYDADTNYALVGLVLETYEDREPVQRPINPPYEEFLAMRKFLTICRNLSRNVDFISRHFWFSMIISFIMLSLT